MGGCSDRVDCTSNARLISFALATNTLAISVFSFLTGLPCLMLMSFCVNSEFLFNLLISFNVFALEG